MKLGELVDQIRKLANHNDPTGVSLVMATSYVSEAMRMTARNLPITLRATGTVADYAVTFADDIFLDIKRIMVDNTWYEKCYDDEMEMRMSTKDFGGRNLWSYYKDTLYVSKKAGDLVVYGNLRPPIYTDSDLAKTIVQAVSPGNDEVVGIVDERQGLVRARAARMACEETSEFDRATYYANIERRLYGDLRAINEEAPGSSIGTMDVSGDWL